ncbi:MULTISPECIES: hypothetical protein [unclassified Francisella]|uniref:hypothetical protein n=1 Tax=unclassified Francisella TaxID=2610885 RepID=UPI002E31D712|nr:MULTISPECIES: hypothetical protein [unclassified Francisella]MED7818451.1 hypothetical protein [Francisella sp. 19S2-4]MED7829294.1 hypothetical protein [Francisella sp. 19S2-10]
MQNIQEFTILIQISLVVLTIVSIIVSGLFILSQQKLVKNLAKANNNQKIHPAWLWTQLIPIWSSIAFVVTAVKLDEQIKLYTLKYSEKLKFKASLVYWYIGFVILGLIPVINILAGLINIFIFITIWSNISSSSKQIQKRL